MVHGAEKPFAPHFLKQNWLIFNTSERKKLQNQ